MEKLNYIVIDGLVRTGKTELAGLLADEFNARLILDDKKNPFSNDFFESISEDNTGMGLKNQLIHLLNRYSQQNSIKQKELFQKGSVSNYLFFREAIYSHVVLNDEDLEIYKRIYGILSENIVIPDLVIYLQISFSEMLRRIRNSENKSERNVPQEYWREVFETYNYYFFNYKMSPLLVVNMEKIDLKNGNDVANLFNEIKNHNKGIKYYAPL